MDRGRYRRLGELGRGGMGVVYEGWDPELRRCVAIKRLRDHTDAHTLERMAREARAVAALSHPNVVQIFDVELGGDAAFIVMELVDGMTLSAWARRERPDWPALLDAYRQAGRGLAAAHAVGLVHRDFKPSNAIIDARGVVKVLDFGLARPNGEGSPSQRGDTPVSSLAATLTASGVAMGTPSYMAPEQHRGDPIDARADVYSFAVALYEALYRRLPFVGVDVDDLYFDKSLGLDPPPPDTRVPASIHDALGRALAWEPTERFSAMDDLLAALESKPVRRRAMWIPAMGLAVGLGVASASLVDLAPTRLAPVAAAIDPELGAEVERLLVVADDDGDHDRSAHGLGTALAALTLAAATGSPPLVARAEIQVGGSFLDSEQFEPAVEWLRVGIAHAREAGEDEAAAEGAVRSIYALGQLGRPHEALAAGREARSLAERVGDDGPLLVKILENEASALPSGEEGTRRLEQVLAMRRASPELGRPRALATTLTSLGHSVFGVDSARARSLQLEALAIRKRVLGPDHRDTLDTLLTLADLDRIAGEYDRCVERGVDAWQRFGPSHRRYRAEAATLVAMCMRAQGRIDEGLRWADRALDEHPGRATEDGQYAVALEVKAALLSGRESWDEAEALLQHTLTIRETKAMGPDPWVATTYHNLAVVARKAGELDRAETYARRSIAGFEATISRTGLIRARTELAAVLLEQGRDAEVLDVLGDDLDIPIDPGPTVDPMLAALSRGIYARALFEREGDRERALELARHALDALARRDDYVDDHEDLLAWMRAHESEPSSRAPASDAG